MKVIDSSSVWGFVSMWEGVLKGTLVCKGDLLKPADGVHQLNIVEEISSMVQINGIITRLTTYNHTLIKNPNQYSIEQYGSVDLVDRNTLLKCRL